jgi:hypothetical protein
MKHLTPTNHASLAWPRAVLQFMAASFAIVIANIPHDEYNSIGEKRFGDDLNYIVKGIIAPGSPEVHEVLLGKIQDV